MLQRRRFLTFVGFVAVSKAQSGRTGTIDLAKGKPNNVAIEPVEHRGRKAVRIRDAATGQAEDRLLVLRGTEEFANGVIDVQLAGEPGEGAAQAARGFVGVAFRIARDLSSFECLYLRPTNGRAEDQIRRNHSVQYISYPNFPWQKLRSESPEKYESYVDLVPGAWTQVRIDIRRDRARLYVHGAEQPTLLVDDLKLGADRRGSVGIWIGPGTLAHAAELRISD